jgi:subtilisin family serine protease
MLAACQDSSAPTAPSSVPFVRASLAGGPETYIVVLPKTATDVQGEANRLSYVRGGSVRATWEHALKGFAVEMTAAAAQDLARQSGVVSVEKDGPITAIGTQSPVGSWGQDRVDQTTSALNNTFNYPNTASNVHAYIIDTGINPTHSEFTGRIGNGANFAGGTGGTNDCNGHGSHVAGTTGGTVYGLAKGVTFHPVRVLDCAGSGQWTWFISGVNWIIANKQLPAVANISLGGGINSGADAAAQNLVAAGVAVNIASGNSNANACNSSPSRVGGAAGTAMTVNATGNYNNGAPANPPQPIDSRASFSNFGSCTDIYAPGVAIKSAWIGGANATNTISGTSMATPHLTGASALYLGANPTATPAQVKAALIANATPNVVTGNPAGTPNKLLYIGFIGGGPPPPTNHSPVASYNVSCVPIQGSQGTCTFTSTSTDPDNDPLTCKWHSSNPFMPDKTGCVITRTTMSGRTWSETLTVTDTGNLSSSTTKSITTP